MKKRRIFLLIFLLLIISLIFLLIYLFQDKSFTHTYDVSDYTVTEEFLGETKQYYYEIKTPKLTYEFVIASKYRGKELLTEIKDYQTKEETCLIPTNEFAEHIIVCSSNNEQISPHLISEELKSQIPEDYIKTYNSNEEQYQNMTIYQEPFNDLYIWNYTGFDYYDETFNTLQIFNKDVYNTDLITTIDNYIVIPDYQNEYNFSQIYLLDINTHKVTTWELDYQISMDSYFLGSYEDSLYLVDKKNVIEYELVPKKQKMRLLAGENGMGKILEKGEWRDKKVLNIISENLTFTDNSIYHYSINDNKLYLTFTGNPILLSNQNVTAIVAYHDDEIYYLVDNSLYYYSPNTNEVLLIKNEEWHFSNTNKIFPIF